jgi:hypothetical protein
MVILLTYKSRLKNTRLYLVPLNGRMNSKNFKLIYSYRLSEIQQNNKTMTSSNRREKQFINSIMLQVGQESRYPGISGIDIEETPDEDIAEEIREWVISYYKATEYVDWSIDDPFGFGIGLNRNGHFVEGGISFNWNVPVNRNGKVILELPQ